MMVATAAAEETRQIGDYHMAVRFDDDEVRAEVATALVIRVTDAGGRPVEGLERALRVEVFGRERTLDRNQELSLRPTRGEPGSYDAVFIPPSAGHYEFRVSGEIAGTLVDERFATGSPGLPDIEPTASFEYGSAGAYIAYALLLAYLIGIGVIAIVMRRQRVRRRALSAE